METVEPRRIGRRPEDEAGELMASWEGRGRRIDIFGHRVFVLEAAAGEGSSGQDLLVLHGFPTSSLDFHPVLEALSSHRRVILHDHVGFGFSDKPADYSYSLFEQAEVALELWRQLGVQRAHVLGHDYGTSVATEILMRRERGGLPFELSSLTLTNGSLFLHLARPRLAQKISRSKLLGPVFGRLVPQSYFSRVIRKLWGDPSRCEPVDLAAMWRGLRLRDGHLRSHQISSYLGERERFLERWTGALERLDVPCHALWARQDPVARVQVAEHLIRLVPGIETTWLDGVGHFPMLEAPEAFAEAAGAFLAKVEAEPDGGRP